MEHRTRRGWARWSTRERALIVGSVAALALLVLGILALRLPIAPGSAPAPAPQPPQVTPSSSS